MESSMRTTTHAARVPVARPMAGLAALLAVSLLSVTCTTDVIAPPGGATDLAFQVDPTDAEAAISIAPAVLVAALDANGDVVTDFSDDVTIAISTNPGSGTLSGTTTVAAVDGIATFTDLSINRTGAGYRLQATSAGLANATSSTFDITPGPAAQLSINTQPGPAVAGANITPALRVQIEDALGNVVTTFTGDVSVAISAGSGASGAALSGTTTVAAVAGIATFSDLSIDKVGASYTFSISASGLLDATSAAFDVIAGPANDLIITVQPNGATAGVDITPAVVVTARDGLGNVATGFTDFVSLAITTGTGTPGATLSGIASVRAVAGVATFTVLNIDRAGTGYTLSASAPGVTGAVTAPFDIAVGPPSVLVFTVQPSSSIAGASIAPAVQVSVEDGSGNLVSGYSGTITIALFDNPGASSLGGTTSVPVVGGIATFPDLSLDKAGTGYTLIVTATDLSGATSDPFNMLAGAGANLEYSVEPTSATAGQGISPAIVVTLKDALGNVATGFNGQVQLAIDNNAGGGLLSGNTDVAAVAGVATFSDISIDKAGTGYTLSATVSGIAPVLSATFDITPGQASQLVYLTQPSGATAGVQIAPAVEVQAFDAFGNIATGFLGVVMVEITAGTGSGGATLSGAVAVAANNGVAAFNTLSINLSGTGYTLAAKATGLTGATSGPFDIAAAAATQLAYMVHPSDAVAGAAIAPAIQVVARDAFGNVATGFTGSVALTISPGTGTAGAALSGTLMVAAIGGVATFSTVSIDLAGAGYTLAASSGALGGATSTGFAIAVGSAAKLVFSVGPATTTAGAAMAPAIEVTAQDASGNTVTGFTGSVTIGIGTNPSGGVLAGTTSATAIAGVASFSNLSIAKSGTGYTLTAGAGGMVGATSGGFNIVAGAATQLTFTVQPGTVTAGASITPAVEVTALDLLGNVATTYTGNVTIALGTNPSAGVLSGTTTVAASAGVASFANLMIDKAGAGYTLVASGNPVTSATSGGFDVTVGVATKLFFNVQPQATTAGATMTPAIELVAQDAAGNLVPSFAGTVTVAITPGTGTVGALLRGTTTVGAAAGVAAFSTLSIDKSGSGYTLRATATGLTAATSAAFAITVGPVVKLGFTVEPVTTRSNTNITPAVRVAGQDSMANTVTTFTGSITVAIGTNAGAPIPGTLTGTLTRTASSGVATFNNLRIDKVGIGYTLITSSGALLGATSLPFDITPGNATQLTFSVPPISSSAGATIPQVRVTALDAAANVATGFVSNITVAIGTNAGAIPGTLSGTLAVAAVAGVSTFSNLSINQAGNGYTLTASASGLTGATSPSFDITDGSLLEFTVQPAQVPMGAAITPAVQVTAKDALGNVVAGFTGNVTVAIASGTGTAGALLGGTKTVAAVGGVATFSDLNIDLAGSGYRLTATATGFTTATSNTFQVTGPPSGPGVKLGFIVEPSNTPAGSIIVPGVKVAVQDVNGNTVGGISGTITIAFGSNPTGATLSGTTTVPINAGTGSFANLSINLPGTYTLLATSTGYTSATSQTFTITSAATLHFVFTTQPSVTTAGQIITPAVQVTALNSSNVTDPSFTGPVTIDITAGTGANGATLSGTKTVNAVSGVATFSDLSITKSGTGFRFSVTSPGVAGATSNSFVINADVPVLLHFSTNPTTTTANTIITPAVVVTVRDQYNNVVRAFSGNVTVAILSGTGNPAAMLAGTKTVAAIEGFATFSNLSIDLLAVGYRLTATAAGVPNPGTSTAFSIN